MSEDKPYLMHRNLFVDDRGYVYGAFDNMDRSGIKRTYVVENHDSGFVRAWHGHKKAHTYMHVISGAAKLAAAPIEGDGGLVVVTASSRSPSIFSVPPGYYNGSMSLEPGTKILVYSTITLEECHSDDFRKPWFELHPGVWDIKWR